MIKTPYSESKIKEFALAGFPINFDDIYVSGNLLENSLSANGDLVIEVVSSEGMNDTCFTAKLIHHKSSEKYWGKEYYGKISDGYIKGYWKLHEPKNLIQRLLNL